MPTDRSGPLTHIARAIADGLPVDWEAIGSAHPELRSRLDKLRLIQSLADSQIRGEGDSDSHREAGGASPEDSPPRDELFRWGPLRARERIGEGSFGEVYRAFDPVLHRDVALKLHRLRAGQQDDPLARHLEEARRLARVRHPNVLTVYGVEVHDGRAGMWTDLLRGRTLEEHLAAASPLDPAEVVSIARDLCSAVAAVHDAGIVHGDIKAANVMREADGRIILMDFGAGSKRWDRPLAGETDDAAVPAIGSVVGTPIVMAPELLHGEPQTVKSDIYALGVLFYRLATGRYPIDAASAEELIARHRSGGFVPLREIRPDLPDPFVRAIERALSAEPEGRYAGAREMLGFLSGSLGEASSRPAHERRERIHNATRPGTNFIGRAAELESIRRLMSASPIVTLLGPGGAGKTRLALQAAEDLTDGFPDGVFWIELAPLAFAERLWFEVARGLGVHEEAGHPIEATLLDHLKGRGILLVLDNCEHLRSACTRLVGEVRGHAPSVRFLATSREPLRVAEEETFAVPPMSIPAARSREDPPEGFEIADAEAVRLFIDRACRSRPGFTLTRANAPAIADICRRLEGIPLAIELAAARANALGADEIASRLKESFWILTKGRETGPAHHATLRASIEWGVRLLSEPERILFRRLSVFSGAWTPTAAEEICADAGGPKGLILGEPILDLLANLIDRSLIAFESPPETDDPGARAPGTTSSSYRMLELLREFARDALIESGEEDGIRAAHLAHFRALAEEAYLKLFGPEQEVWLKRLARERDNLRGALDWCRNPRSDIDAGLRIAWILRRFWFVRGELTEGRGYFKALLERGDGTPRNRTSALLAAGMLAWAQADQEEGERLANEALQMARELNDQNDLAGILVTLGTMLSDRGEYDRARSMLEEALGFRRALGNKNALASLLCNLGVLLARVGDLGSAATRYAEAAALLEEVGDLPTLAIVLNNLSMTARDLGDFPRARELAERSVPILRASGNRRGLSQTILNLAKLDLTDGKFAHSRELHIESLLIARDMDDMGQTIEILESLGELCVAQGDRDRGARLFGAIDLLRESAGFPLHPSAVAPHERFVDLAREALGEGGFAAARAFGRTLDLAKLIAYAQGL